MASVQLYRPLPAHRPAAARGVHSILCKVECLVLGHVDAHPARSHPTHSRHSFDHLLTKQPVSRDRWRGREKESPRRPAFIKFHCKYRIFYGVSEWLYYLLHSSFDVDTDRFDAKVPFIDISDTALDSWKQDRLADTEASLTRTITNSAHPSHHVFAKRALVRAHLRHWNVAIEDAEKVHLHLLLPPTRLCPLLNASSPSGFSRLSLATSQRV